MFDSYVVPGRVLEGHGSDLAAGGWRPKEWCRVGHFDSRVSSPRVVGVFEGAHVVCPGAGDHSDL